jgi:hypothetical protein
MEFEVSSDSGMEMGFQIRSDKTQLKLCTRFDVTCQIQQN